MKIEYKNKSIVFSSGKDKAKIEIGQNICLSFNEKAKIENNFLKNINKDYEAWLEHTDKSITTIKIGKKRTHYYLLTIGDILSNDKFYHKIIVCVCKDFEEVKSLNLKDKNSIDALIRIYFGRICGSKYRCFDFKEIKLINSFCNSSNYKKVYF